MRSEGQTKVDSCREVHLPPPPLPFCVALKPHNGVFPLELPLKVWRYFTFTSVPLIHSYDRCSLAYTCIDDQTKSETNKLCQPIRKEYSKILHKHDVIVLVIVISEMNANTTK